MAIYLESTFGTWKLPQGDSLLGRGADCQIRLDDLRLSRRHAILHLDGATLTVDDAGSSNGVLVDGDRIDGPTALIHGASLVTGPFAFRVRHAPEERDPSRIQSEAVRQRSPTSDEFSPSTDRAARRTHDMMPRVESRPIESSTARPDDEGTEARNWDDSKPSVALTERRNRRRLAPMIEDAVSSGETSEHLRPGTSGPRPMTDPRAAKKGTGTEVLMPSEQGRKKHTEALLPHDEHGRPLMRGSEGSLPVAPLAVEQASTRSRLVAAMVDAGTTALLSTIGFLVPLLMGWSLAHWLATPANEAFDWWRTVGPLLAFDGFEHAATRATIWHQEGGAAWCTFYGGLACGVIVALLVPIFLVVGPTTLHGGPRLHRRLGLAVIDDTSGHFPNPGQALLRTIILGCTAPLAIITCALGKRGLHDLAVGCTVHKRAG